MEFTIEREVFLRVLQKTLGVVERKASLPIMGNILIEASGTGIRIVATDREISLTVGSDASVIKEGYLTLPARKLYETVRELQGETLHLVEAAGSMAILTSNKAVCKLKGLPAEEFPRVDVHDGFRFSQVKASLLRDMIGHVHFAIACDDERKTLEGVSLEKEIADIDDGPLTCRTTLIRMVATDGHRLALIKTDVSEQARQSKEPVAIPEKGVIIPRKGLQEIRKLLDGIAEGDVSIGIEGSTCIVKDEKNTLSVSLIDGSFPDYRRVIPQRQDEDVVISIEKTSLLHGLRRMGVIAPESVSLTISENLLVLNAVHADVGEIRDEIEVQYQGEGKVAKFNGTYLIDGIEAVSGNTIELRLPVGRDMGLIRDAENDGYLCIVMALKN